VLLNTRGWVVLSVLNIGLDLGAISPTLFAMLVLMAIVNTMATAPSVRLLQPGHRPSLHDSGLPADGQDEGKVP